MKCCASAADAPVPHWHYITYGFSELYAKESSDADASGYGSELTFRLAAVDEPGALCVRQRQRVRGWPPPQRQRSDRAGDRHPAVPPGLHCRSAVAGT
ncbi:hypothetical protein G6F45_013943 [Rhizopus arrhizus]|nr:hypothetical protein G6F45_013943 [Rhizopus arrhizus]